jgi:hypothetical protein
MWKIFNSLLFIISKIPEIKSEITDLNLWSVDEVLNTDKLFTGIAYQLEHPSDSSVNLAWDKGYGRFQFVNKTDPVDISALFYLVNAENGYYYLRNALKNSDVETRCIRANEARNCYITVQDYPSSELLYSWYLFIQLLTSELPATNIYQMNNS